jgi:hemerythrin-like domain-containing protein
MTSDSENKKTTDPDNPLTDFSSCHADILQSLKLLRSVAKSSGGKDPEGRKTAANLLKFFDEVVIEHHRDEEQELFVAVLQSTKGSDEAKHAKAMVNRLVDEHLKLEKLWKDIKPQLKRIVKGKTIKLNKPVIRQLADDYQAHAEFEEQEFLPFAARVLQEQGLSALGLSLHLKHSDAVIFGYI